jgi:uncharacterized protein DUF2459
VSRRDASAAGRGRCAVAGLALVAAACVSHVEPPRAPSDPVVVYLRREARHSALILPDPAGGHVEYGYGDWNWYALEKDRWYHVFGTLFWPTRGTLGRCRLEARSAEELESAYPYSRMSAINVERERASELARRLDEEFRAGEATRIHSATYQLDFVQHASSFCLFHNCHDALADWLQSLGCRVSRALVRTGLEVEERSAASP